MIVRVARGVCRWYIRLIPWLTPAVPRQRELASSRGPMARAVPRHARVAAGATAERADEVEELEVEVKPLPLGLGVRASLHDWHTWLVQPVHVAVAACACCWLLVPVAVTDSTKINPHNFKNTVTDSTKISPHDLRNTVTDSTKPSPP